MQLTHLIIKWRVLKYGQDHLQLGDSWLVLPADSNGVIDVEFVVEVKLGMERQTQEAALISGPVRRVHFIRDVEERVWETWSILGAGETAYGH